MQVRLEEARKDLFLGLQAVAAQQLGCDEAIGPAGKVDLGRANS